MGSLYQRGNVWWLMYRQHGRLIRESSRSKKERVALRKLKVREGDVEKGEIIAPKRDLVTFDAAADDLLNDYTTNGKRSITVCRRRVVKHLEPYFRGRRLASITTADIRAFIAKRQADTINVRQAHQVTADDGAVTDVPAVTKPVSAGEINRELTTLKRIFSLAVQADKLSRKPHVPMLQERNTRIGFFETEALEAVTAALPGPVRAVVTFAYLTGWRAVSEVLPLEWRQVDFEAGEIRLDAGTTKNGEGRVFPMTADLRTLLEARQAERDALKAKGIITARVFFRLVRERERTPEAKPITSFIKAWRSACTAAGYPGRIPHDLRRTAVRNLVRAGIPERVAMTMTGHKTRSVFERYNIVSGGDLTDAAAKLDALRGDHTSDHSQAPEAKPAGRVIRIA